MLVSGGWLGWGAVSYNTTHWASIHAVKSRCICIMHIYCNVNLTAMGMKTDLVCWGEGVTMPLGNAGCWSPDAPGTLAWWKLSYSRDFSKSLFMNMCEHFRCHVHDNDQRRHIRRQGLNLVLHYVCFRAISEGNPLEQEASLCVYYAQELTRNQL